HRLLVAPRLDHDAGDGGAADPRRDASRRPDGDPMVAAPRPRSAGGNHHRGRPAMRDRTVLDAARTRLGADAVARLRRLRRRLWWRRAVRSGLVAIAAAALLVAVVQLLARAFPLEHAPWIQAGVTAVSLVAWLTDAVRRRPSVVEAARLADEELGLRQRLGTALELAEHETSDPL